MGNRSRKKKLASRPSKGIATTSSAVQSTPTSVRRDWLWGLILMLAVILAYTPLWKAGFVWDDETILTSNPCVVGPLGLKEIWTTSAADICPLTLTTLWLEHALWGLNPVPYHLVNVLLHGACVLLLWRSLRSLRVPGAWLGAALWALHPVAVESVAWITEMKNTESGFYFLLSILFFVRWLRAKGPGGRTGGEWNYALSVFFAGLAMASKSSTVILPVVLSLCAWWIEGRLNWRSAVRTIPFFLMAIAASALSIWTQTLHPGIVTEQQWVRTWPQRLCAAGDAVWFYLGKLLWPQPLMIIYPRWRIEAGSWVSYLPLLAVIVVLSIFWINRERWSRACFFAFAYFLVALLPILGLIDNPIFRYSLVFDHLQYLASIGPLALAGAGLARCWDFLSNSSAGTPITRIANQLQILASKNPWLGPAFCAGLLMILGTTSWQRTWSYETEERLWSDTLAKNPDCWVGYNNLGLTYFRKGRLGEAISQYKKALEINPGYVDAHGNFGHALLQAGQLDRSLAEFQKALELNPKYAVAHSNFGAALLRSGRVSEAVAECQKALEINPGYADAHNNLGAALFQKGQVDEAITQYQRALEVKPGYAEAYYNLGVALFEKGQVDEAIAQYQEALKINPGYAEAHCNFGLALIGKGKLDDAIAQYQSALGINPNYAEARYNLGVALYQKGQLDEAVTEFRKAVEINPNYADAHTNLGNVLLREGQMDEAIAQFQTAVKLNSNDPETHNNLGNALLQKGRMDDAVAEYQRAVEINPSYAEAHSNLGLALLRQGQSDEAVDEFQKALNIKPDFFETHYALGVALAQKGELQEAITQFREVLRLKPDFTPAQENLATAEALVQQRESHH